MTNPTLLAINFSTRERHVCLIGEPPDGRSEIIIFAAKFYGIGGEFSGFYDWLRIGGNPTVENHLYGVELFPFDEGLGAEMLESPHCKVGAGGGIDLAFGLCDRNPISGNEQAFGYYRYFRNDKGGLAVAIGMDGLSEQEISVLTECLK